MPELFGVDERTSEPIPFDHLDKIPWTRTLQSTEQPTDLLAADPDVLQAYCNERYSG